MGTPPLKFEEVADTLSVTSARAPRLSAGPGRRSLSARALLFTLVGSGALFGVLIVISAQILDGAQDRLFEERGRLARATARLLERQLESDMSRLADAANLFIQPHEHSAFHMSHGVVLSHAAAHTAFKEGVFVLDPTGAPLASAPGPMDELRRLPGLDALLATVRAQGSIVMSSLVTIGKKPVLIAVGPVPHEGPRVEGFVVALFQFAATDLLKDLRDEATRGQAELALLDQAGNVVASTDRQQILEARSSNEVLCSAAAAQRETQGACQRCSPEDADCTAAVMAFAPLPKLRLGLSVVQARAIALGPAEALQTRLWTLGGALIVLFVLFNLLAVRSVVRPVARLTEAVRRTAPDSGALFPMAYGDDEVGELAQALTEARNQVLLALNTAQRSQEDLRIERDLVQQHLQVLKGISDASTAAQSLDGFFAAALEQIIEGALSLGGALLFRHGDLEVMSQRGAQSDETKAAIEALMATEGDVQSLSPTPDSRPPLIGRVTGPQAPLRLGVVLSLDDDGRTPSAVALQGAIEHAAVCAGHLLLRDALREREAQRSRFLHQVMKAQEDERSRVARELHDTVAQDLAALRLSIERSANHSEEAKTRAELNTLEKGASEMLDSVRRILLDLRLSILDNLGFVPGLRWLVDRANGERGLRTHFALDGQEGPVRYLVAVSVFRILQETLLNVQQHAQAQHVFVTLRLSESVLELLVEDDGCGFEANPAGALSPGADGHGMGLLGIQERAHLVGGSLEISSAPNEGTSLKVCVPDPYEGPGDKE